MTKVNIKYKDRLFRMVFSQKEDLLDLYNAIAGTGYADPEELEITTLEDVIYMGMKNDISFFIDDVLNLWEHQSSWNPNMPLRGVFYFADEYRGYVKKRGLNLYGSRLIVLPVPQYIVFYNGLREEPDRLEMNLSDAYSIRAEKGIMAPCLEFKAILLNINLGHNRDLMGRCRKLKEYSEFVAIVRANLEKGMVLEEAADQAVEMCIEQGILAEFLSVHRAEVCDVILTEYDEQRHIADEKEASWEEGRKEGYREGSEIGKLEAAVCQIRRKYNKNLTAGQAAEELELEKKFVTEVMELLKEHSADSDIGIAECLMGRE